MRVLKGTAILTSTSILTLLGGCGGGPRDDWQYSPPTFDEGDPMPYLLAVGAVLLAWLIAGLVLVIRGKAVTDESGRKRMSRSRKIGIALLAPLALFLVLAVAASFLTLGASGGMDSAAPLAAAPVVQSAAAPTRLGLSAGGATNAASFRRLIKTGQLPQPSDLATEGLFAEYFFDTGQRQPCDELFCPSYARAVSRDPLGGPEGEVNRYLSVGLNSNLTEEDFSRRRLDLVIVLDISGSMSSPFSRRRINQNSEQDDEDDEDRDAPKMEVATKAVAALLEHLRPDDRLGIVLFDNDAYLAKPLNLVSETDLEAIRGHVLELQPRGGTNMSAGLDLGTSLFEGLGDYDATAEERRIIFLTDAMPNLGDTSEGGLLGRTSRNAEQGLYTTFIGVGIDFQTELIQRITRIRGANYHAVHSSREFHRRLADDFEYLVTPLVFDLELQLIAEGWEIEDVAGSPDVDLSTGQVMHIRTLFPSPTKSGETRGGLVLLKLRQTAPEGLLKLRTSWVDRAGQAGSDEQRVTEFGARAPEFFENTGIRKGVLLARYADLLRGWMRSERRQGESASNEQRPQWEQRQVKMTISDADRQRFTQFARHFDSEMELLDDLTLRQELEVLQTIIRQAEPRAAQTTDAVDRGDEADAADAAEE